MLWFLIYLVIATALALAVHTVLLSKNRSSFGLHIYIMMGLLWPITIACMIWKVYQIRNEDPGL